MSAGMVIGLVCMALVIGVVIGAMVMGLVRSAGETTRAIERESFGGGEVKPPLFVMTKDGIVRKPTPAEIEELVGYIHVELGANALAHGDGFGPAPLHQERSTPPEGGDEPPLTSSGLRPSPCSARELALELRDALNAYGAWSLTDRSVVYLEKVAEHLAAQLGVQLCGPSPVWSAPQLQEWKCDCAKQPDRQAVCEHCQERAARAFGALARPSSKASP